MKSQARKLLAIASLVAVFGTLLVAQGQAAAQFGYTPDEAVTVRVGSGKVDFDGKFNINYTTAPVVEDPHLIYLIGTDEDGQPFEWLIVQIMPGMSDLGLTVEGSNLQPGSYFGLEARYDGQTLADDQIAEAATLVRESTDAEIVVVDLVSGTELGSSDSDDDSQTANLSSADDDDEEALGPEADSSDSDGGTIRNIVLGLLVLGAVTIGAVAYGKRLRTRYT